MSSRRTSLFLSALAWAGFVVVVLWTVCFLAGVGVPRTVDGPTRTTTGLAVAADLGLLVLFAVQHSVMARREFKSWLRRWVPASLERTTFVLATNACLVGLLVLWQPFGGEVWEVNGPAAVVLWLLCAAGWLSAVTATFAIDHLELTGLRQAGWAAPRSPAPVAELQTGGLYAVVRHPLLTGMVLAFWATPHMSASHLLFALGATVYVAVGMRFEERDLRRSFGAPYDAYAAHVPALVPGFPLRRGPVAVAIPGRGDAAAGMGRPGSQTQVAGGTSPNSVSRTGDTMMELSMAARRGRRCRGRGRW